MKKQIFLTILAAAAFAACKKDEATSPAGVPATSLDLSEAIYVFDNSETGFQRVDLDAAQLEGGAMKSEGNAHAHGNYSTPYRPHPQFYKSENVRFSGTQNANGVFGEATIERFWGDNGEYSFTINLTADCVETDGNDAVYACVVSGPSTGTLPPELITFLGGDFPIGSRFWIRVRDNGQGANAPADQASPGIVYNTSGMIPCPLFGLSSFIWVIQPMADVANASDNIVVN